MTSIVFNRSMDRQSIDRDSMDQQSMDQRSMGSRAKGGAMGGKSAEARSARVTSSGVTCGLSCFADHAASGLLVAAIVALVACIAVVRGAVVQPPSAAAGDESLRTVRVAVPPHRVDIDRADIGELGLLPEVGPGLAARIVANRAVHGAFGSVDVLARVEGIGPARLEAIRPKARASGVSGASAASPPTSAREAGHEDGAHRGVGAELLDG